MKVLVYIIIIGVVSGLIDWMTYKKSPKRYTRSIYHFTVRTPLSLAALGAFGFVFFTGVMLFAFTDSKNIVMWKSSLLMRVIYYVMLSICIFLMAAPLPRFWDVVVDGDDITIIKLFIFKKQFHVKDIRCCVMKTGEVWVYAKNRKRVAFLVDASCNGVDNFMKRMEKENIEIIDKRKFPEQNED